MKKNIDSANRMADPNLKMARKLNPVNIWGLALGAMIGFGCFMLPGQSFLPRGGPLGAIGGFFIGALMVLFIAMSYSYLIAHFPISGGEYVYAYVSFGKKIAFICGWFLLIAYWCLVPMNATAVGLIGRYLFPGVVQGKLLYTLAGWDVYSGEVIVSLLAIVVIGLINLRGVQIAGWFQTAIAFALVGSVFVIFSMALIGGTDFNNLKPAFPVGIRPLNAILGITAIAPFLYIGFDCIPQAAEEYSFSHKNTLKILISSILLASCIYAAVTFITALVFPWWDYIQSRPDWATGLAVETVAGKIGLFFLGIAMFCAILSGMNAFYLSGSRLLYAMSESDAIPKRFSIIDPKSRVPKNAIIFLMLPSLIAPFFGRQVLGWLVDMTAVGAAMGYFLTCASAARIAASEGKKFQQIISAFGSVFSVIFLLLLIIPFSPGALTFPSWIWLLAWLVLGIIFFQYQWKIFKNSSRLQEEISSFNQLYDESKID